jgi:hypothetical protein
MSDHEKQRIKAAHKAGARWAIAWLHKRALGMNDPHARVILNTAGYHMGIELSRSDVLPAPSMAESEIEHYAKLKVSQFADAILHGDDEHRQWLLEAAEAFNGGLPMPPPRGKGASVTASPEGVKS